ncbi:MULTISPECIES: hypothetical protein [Endozoicomonas]|uniref:hypothetical protein n=1 Tax=Endozoicomonas TaxID=305899 RepID=UPI00082666ED|nr:MULTISPECIES: hypothetical protein [Endozoicomonas]USE36771.1 hypothetical protein MJO57_00565 [Endozoicomonas sp. SCSIO W0465]
MTIPLQPHHNLQTTREASGVTLNGMEAMIGISASNCARGNNGQVTGVTCSTETGRLPEKEYSEKVPPRAVATLIRDGVEFTIEQDECHLIGIALQAKGGGA